MVQIGNRIWGKYLLARPFSVGNTHYRDTGSGDGPAQQAVFSDVFSPGDLLHRGEVQICPISPLNKEYALPVHQTGDRYVCY